MILAGVLRGRGALARAQLWTRSRGRTRPRSGAVSLLFAAASAAGLAWALSYAFAGLRELGVQEPAARALLGWLFAATLTGVLVFDLHQALAALVAAPDLDLLRAAPLSPRALAALRLAEALPASLPIVLTLALPAAVGFASAYGAPAAGVAGVVLALAALWLAPLGAGLALALPLARLLPPTRARDLLGTLSTFALVAAWLANALLVPRAGTFGGPGSGAGALASLPGPPRWLPARWAADALAPAVDGTALAALAMAALAGSALAWWSTERHLAAALERTMDAPRRTGRGFGPARATRSLTAAFLARDARLFARQWSVAADVVAASLLWLLLPLFAVPIVPAAADELARAMLVMLAVGLGYEIGARALALERSGLVWAHLAPVGPARWLAGRLAGVGVLAAVLLLPAVLAVWVGFRLPAAALPGLLEWAGAAVLLSLSLGLLTGAAFADPEWSHPRAMLGLTGRLAGVVLLLIQVAGWLTLAALPFRLAPGALALGSLVVSLLLLGLGARILGRRGR